jgi:hypothetical protein
MVLRGKRSVLTAILVLALLFAAAPGWAAQRRSPAISGWEGLWQRVVAWVVERVSPTAGWSKSSSSIDPLGQPQGTTPPADSAQSDSSAGIDPLGQH